MYNVHFFFFANYGSCITKISFISHKNVMTMIHLFAELCYWCTRNGYCNIFNGYRLQMLSGLLHCLNKF